jgi:hypothetical protein
MGLPLIHDVLDYQERDEHSVDSYEQVVLIQGLQLPVEGKRNYWDNHECNEQNEETCSGCSVIILEVVAVHFIEMLQNNPNHEAVKDLNGFQQI